MNFVVDQTCTQHRGKNGKKQGAGADPHVLSFLGFLKFPLSSRAKQAVFSIFLTLSQVSSVFSGRPSRIKPWSPWNLQAPLLGFLRQAAPSQTLEPLEPVGTLAEMLSYTHIYFLFVSFFVFVRCFCCEIRARKFTIFWQYGKKI